ncbi:maleylpyruvate isomerase family mycothiol-dependent enzyme [Nocardioides mangrovi]|uniref:Maleylpyruvate isomerase family mycothiol-dependent enzyme n=1 Tax=Nocardioides mangrovi TaxID=2874580 RepID=A0ABS7UDK6_9ACTN|nr:maleylpyruvate isomerase family mycothiol-dependent enzyme [Nocardioides mangrovi]MBZ5738905.1 maleylpyruvate isomerase family mycothiol-dependent enzyme [Nocardioides mangrovi]
MTAPSTAPSAELVDRVIAALRLNHDVLVTLVPHLSEEQLTGPSGASEWTIAQVLSHLGSGAEISRKPIARAVGLDVADEDNQSIWARWDGSTPIDQAAGFVEHDTALVDLVERLSDEDKASATIDMGFLPEPVPLVVALGMRLNEVANHVWDVRVGLDPAAEVDDETAAVLVELYQGPLAFLLGFSGKADQVDGSVLLAVPGAGIEIADAVTVVGSADAPDATLTGPSGATVRLISGRLTPEHSDGVEVSGAVSLEDLRKVFPGY